MTRPTPKFSILLLHIPLGGMDTAMRCTYVDAMERRCGGSPAWPVMYTAVPDKRFVFDGDPLNLCAHHARKTGLAIAHGMDKRVGMMMMMGYPFKDSEVFA